MILPLLLLKFQCFIYYIFPPVSETLSFSADQRKNEPPLEKLKSLKAATRDVL